MGVHELRSRVINLNDTLEPVFSATGVVKGNPNPSCFAT